MIAPLFSKSLNSNNSVEIDLSIQSELLRTLDNNMNGLDLQISEYLDFHNADYAYGGYLEKRNLYKRVNHFASDERNIHLGIDVWSKNLELIHAPLDAEVILSHWHEIAGDYGGVIILRHSINDELIHSLYGHLSKESIHLNKKGNIIPKGEKFATLGEPKENGNWPIHLHFQLIKQDSIEGNNFPGVCSAQDLELYQSICPNPIDWVIQK